MSEVTFIPSEYAAKGVVIGHPETIAEVKSMVDALRARITELTQCDPSWYDMSVSDAFRMWKADREELVDWRKVDEDHKRLVRKLDVLWNGEEGAAKQASLCDVVSQIERELARVKREAAQWHRLHDELAEKGSAHVMRLQSALSRSRADALEEAARKADDKADLLRPYARSSYYAETREFECQELAKAIRAALQTTPPSPSYAAGMEGLSPMSTAPRDGTEILAYHVDGANYHPVAWRDGHWGMRWTREYCCADGFYSGWIPYPTKATTPAATNSTVGEAG